MQYDLQNSIFKSPIPLLVGNISLSSSFKDEYQYVYPYIVDIDKHMYYFDINDTAIITYDQIDKSWRLIEEYDGNCFTQLSSSNGIYYMNPFVNINGYPQFDKSQSPINNSDTLFYDKYSDKWCIGVNVKTVSGQTYSEMALDTNDSKYGNANTVSSYIISSFVTDKPEINPLKTNYYLYSGNITTTSSLLIFKDTKNQLEPISGYMLPYQDSIKRSDESPLIISGEPCLGYYFKTPSGTPIVIGSICIGTEDLTTVPPIIGQNSLGLEPNNYNFTDSRDVFPGILSGEWDEEGFWWIGTTFDPNKPKWNLFQILSPYWEDFDPAFASFNYILTSGDYRLVNPTTAERFWYCSGYYFDDLFSYNKLKDGLTFHPYPNGSTLNIKIVGLTSFNADEVKHPGDSKQLNVPTYIGNWITPQPTWR